jgi:hypothetical protein
MHGSEITGMAAVSAPKVLGGAFHDKHSSPLFRRAQSRAESSVPATSHQNIDSRQVEQSEL